MRRLCIALAILLSALAVSSAAEEAAPTPTGKAKIRFVAIFMSGFTVWKLPHASCTKQTTAPEPWFQLDCGAMRCPKPVLLGMPAPPSYSNWQKSPRVREIEVDAGVPLSFKLTGALNEFFGGDTIKTSLCDFNARFIPEAGKMYEASLDPENHSCQMTLTVMANPYGWWEKTPFEGAHINNCSLPVAAEDL